VLIAAHMPEGANPQIFGRPEHKHASTQRIQIGTSAFFTAPGELRSDGAV